MQVDLTLDAALGLVVMVEQNAPRPEPRIESSDHASCRPSSLVQYASIPTLSVRDLSEGKTSKTLVVSNPCHVCDSQSHEGSNGCPARRHHRQFFHAKWLTRNPR